MLKRIILSALPLLMLLLIGASVKKKTDKKELTGREYQRISAEKNNKYDIISVSKTVKERGGEVLKLNKYFSIDTGYQLINEFHLTDKLTFDQKKEFINLFFGNLDKNGSENEFVIAKYFDDGTNLHFFVKFTAKSGKESENFLKYYGAEDNIKGYIRIETNAPIYSITDKNFSSKYVVDVKKSLEKIPQSWVYKRRIEIYGDKPIFSLKTMSTIKENLKYLPFTAFELFRDQDFTNDEDVKKNLQEKLAAVADNQSKENNLIRLNLVLYNLINDDIKNAKSLLGQIKNIGSDTVVEIVKKLEFGEGEKKITIEKKEAVDIAVIKKMLEEQIQIIEKM